MISVHGAFVTQINIQNGVEISGLMWSCRRFLNKSEQSKLSSPSGDRSCQLAFSFVDGSIYLMLNYDDMFPIEIHTGLSCLKMEWSHGGRILAVAGHQVVRSTDRVGYEYTNVLNFYDSYGTLIKSTVLDFTIQPVSALAWGCDDRRLFVACGQLLYVGWISTW